MSPGERRQLVGRPQLLEVDVVADVPAEMELEGAAGSDARLPFDVELVEADPADGALAVGHLGEEGRLAPAPEDEPELVQALERRARLIVRARAVDAQTEADPARVRSGPPGALGQRLAVAPVDLRQEAQVGAEVAADVLVGGGEPPVARVVVVGEVERVVRELARGLVVGLDDLRRVLGARAERLDTERVDRAEPEEAVEPGDLVGVVVRPRATSRRRRARSRRRDRAGSARRRRSSRPEARRASERSAPGMRSEVRASSAMKAPKAEAPRLPVTFAPQSGSATLRVKTIWNGVVKMSAPSRKNGRRSG